MPGLQDDIDDITETSQDVMRYLSARRQGGMGRGRPQQLPTPGRAPSSGHSVVPRLASTNWPPPSLQSPSPSSRHTTLPTTSAVSSPLPAFQQQAFNQDMQSSFAYLRRNVVRSKKRPAALSKLSPAICKKYVRLQFFLVPGPTDRTPNASEEIKLLEAGLGKRTVTMAEDAGHDEIVSLLEAHYSKLKKLEGAWLYHKATGGQGQRKLNQVTGDDEGYTGSFLKSVTSNGRYILYIVPIQEELDVTPLPHDAEEFSKMPKACCKRCGVVMPLQFLTLHIKSCAVEEISDVPQSIDDEDLAIIEDENEDFAIYEETEDSATLEEMCPICGEPFPKEDIAWHASSCGDGIPAGSSPFGSSGRVSMFPKFYTVPRRTSPTAAVGTSAAPGPSHTSAAGPSHTSVGPAVPDWQEIEVASRAAALFRTRMFREQQGEPALRVTLDLRSDVTHRESSVIAFYKRKRPKWAAELFCVLEGDLAIGKGVKRFFISFAMHILQSGLHMNFGTADITRLFEGQQDHLIPCTSQPLIDSDLFLMAGRILGHSFLHGGPGLAGISPAIVHVLLGGPLETATLGLEDCPDFDQRNTIQLVFVSVVKRTNMEAVKETGVSRECGLEWGKLEGNEELSEDQKSDVGHLTDQFQLPPLTDENRKYIHQTLLQQVVLGRTTPQVRQLRKGLKETGVWPILTGRKDVAETVFPKMVGLSPQVMIELITWPSATEDEEDEDYPLETRSRIGTYLRQFIETAPADCLVDLLKFWTAWEVLSGELIVEVRSGQFPTSQTCFQTLRLPGHFKTYEDFEKALQASISTVNTGFGMH